MTSTRRTGRRRAPAAAALLVGLLAGCAATSTAAPGPSATGGGPTADAEGVVHVVTDPHVAPLTPTPQPQLPVTVESFDGVEVTVTDTSRILALDLYGTLAETVFSLGLGDNVVGRDTSTGFTEAAHLPEVTVGGHSISAEAVLELDPTVVLTDASLGPPEAQQQLREAGVPVVFFDPTRTLDGVGPQIEAVAAALGVPDAGHELAQRTRAEITDALADVTPADPAQAERVAFLYLRGSAVMMLGGPGSGADELIGAIGAQDAGTAVGLDRQFVPITSEALASAAPDVLLLFDGGLDSVGGVDGLLRVPGVAQTPAGADLRVVTVDDTALLGFGPRTAATLRALADAVAASGAPAGAG